MIKPYRDCFGQMTACLGLLVLPPLLACSSPDAGPAAGASAGSGNVAGAGSGGSPATSAGTSSGGTNDAAGNGSAGSAGSAGTPSAAGTGGMAGAAGASGGAGGNAGGAAGGATGAWKCPAGPFASDPVPAGATAMEVAGLPPADDYREGQEHIIEGPLWFDGALYVSQITNVGLPPKARVLKLLNGAVSIVMDDAGTNGLAVDGMGQIHGGRHEDGSISKLSLAGPASATPVVAKYDGKRFNSPNDLAFRSDGTLYFSDPDYQADPSDKQPDTRVYRVAPGSTTAVVVDDSLNQPNGVTLSLDEKTLFVTHASGLRRYPVMADGSTGAGTAVPGGPAGDGMGMDCAGNLYVTGEGVTVLDPSGVKIDTIAIPVGWVTNVAFGGPERKTLYVTYLGDKAGLYKVELSVPGLPY